MAASLRPLSIPHRPALLAVMLLAALAGCGKKDEAAAKGGPPGGGMPPAEVSVVTVQPTTVGLVTELPGRLEASRVAQVRARAAGILRERLFREGSDVKAGQPLFSIDAAPYQAALESALAAQAKAEAAQAQAASQVERYKPLVEANAISKQDYVNAVAQQKTSAADVAAAKAAVQTQRINLGYTQVTAPISGRIGRALVTEGALVGTGEATQLAVIQQVNPMYLNFTQSTTDTLRLRKALAAGKLQRAGGDQAARVRVVLDDGSEYPHAGRLLFSDLTVDATSGQVTLRAEVPNPDGLLLPGMYVRVRLQQAEQPGGILLPQQAVTRSNTGDTVLVVGADSKPAPRPVKVAQAQDNQWLITDGLKPGEQVIVAGFQKMMVPGAPVKPVPWTGNAAGAAPAPGASGPVGPAAAGSAPAAGTVAAKASGQ